MPERMVRLPVTRAILFLSSLLITTGLVACGVRPYDYVAPYLQTLSNPYKKTVTVTKTLHMVPTFTPMPSASATITLTSTAFQIIHQESLTPTTGIKPLEGTAEILLENRTGVTLVLELEGLQSFGYEITPGGVLQAHIPAGTYRYWLILPGQQSLRGSKIFYPGPSTWTFYRTPSVIESPTPKWP